tara:strand:- start:1112 stop:1858 length:747 start_codon:yes stop_codon:yes gene_type:complete
MASLINGTRNGRWYKIGDEEVPSVTTVLNGFKNPHWLMEFLVKQAGGDTRLLYDKKSEALRIGTLVHESIDKILNNESIIIEHDHEVQKALISFLGFWKKFNPKPIAKETTLYCEEQRNGSLRFPFAGTADLVAEIDGELWMLDYKTSQQLNPDMGLQLTAYKMLWDCSHDRKIDRLGIVWCKKNFKGKYPTKTTKYLHEYEYTPRDWYCVFKVFKKYSVDSRGNFGPKMKVNYMTEFNLDLLSELDF